MKKIAVLALCALLCMQSMTCDTGMSHVFAEEMNETQEEDEKQAEEAKEGVSITAPEGILMEASTGKVIFEKNADEVRPPASVTKIMTLLLIFDAIDAGKITLDEEVQVSEFAASMGGSQVFLEPGEIQTVETMIKCIAVASANDACVAMAEHICGSEEEFVNKMNERAKSLGMENTNFVNCNGLDTDGHETSARDIAIMSRELITKYPQIHDYSMIWMENITHHTAKGDSEFGLTNTNKLVRQYQYTTGLKTGSTDKAKFCVSATAKKNEMEMIAVIMAAENSKERFKDAMTLLNYGFGKCVKYIDDGIEALPNAEVERGEKDELSVRQKEKFEYIDTNGQDLSQIKKQIELNTNVKAPVKKNDKVGEVTYSLNGEKIGSADIVACEDIAAMDYKIALENTLDELFL